MQTEIRAAFDTYAVFVEEWQKTMIVPAWLRERDPDTADGLMDAEQAWRAFSGDVPGDTMVVLSEKQYREFVAMRAMGELAYALRTAVSEADGALIKKALGKRLRAKGSTVWVDTVRGTLSVQECRCYDCMHRRQQDGVVN
jgi:hypothetical protein